MKEADRKFLFSFIFTNFPQHLPLSYLFLQTVKEKAELNSPCQSANGECTRSALH